jgi:hypothetical protein
MEHIGLDVHKKESQICILAEGGEVNERRIRTDRERFAVVLNERLRSRVLIEVRPKVSEAASRVHCARPSIWLLVGAVTPAAMLTPLTTSA